MKKLFALCLALAMALTLCACGGKTSKEEMIGTWERKVNGDSGDTIKQVIEVYEGEPACIITSPKTHISTVLLTLHGR